MTTHKIFEHYIHEAIQQISEINESVLQVTT